MSRPGLLQARLLSQVALDAALAAVRNYVAHCIITYAARAYARLAATPGNLIQLRLGEFDWAGFLRAGRAGYACSQILHERSPGAHGRARIIYIRLRHPELAL
jgi:hypothetical protein